MGPPSERTRGESHGQFGVLHTTGPHCTLNDQGYNNFQIDGIFRDTWNFVPEEGFNPETEPLAPIQWVPTSRTPGIELPSNWGATPHGDNYQHQ